MTFFSRRSMAARIGIVIVALLVAFGIWTLATLQIPGVRYGDPARPISGTGAAMPISTGVDGEWASTGRDPGGSQWSPLAQVAPGNVGQLKVAWVHHSGDFKNGDAYSGTRDEQTPLVIGKTLYFCTPFDRVLALDAQTGTDRWAFDPRKPMGASPALFSDKMQPKHCRGLAYWHDAAAAAGSVCADRIYRSSGDRAIVALDAATGVPCGDFGNDKGHHGFVTHADFDAKGEGPVPASSPPIVVNNVLVAAAGARDNFVDAADGLVRGFDARSGKLLWEWDPIPAEHVHETGAANIWSLLSADPKRKLVFLATTEPSPDYYGATRKFDVPYANSVVALSVETGKPVWHYQIVRHDVFDYDLPSHPMLVTIHKDGRPRDVVIQQTKSGMLFVLDRDTGKPLFPIDEYRAPASELPGEKLSPTQPVPRLPEAFERMKVSVDDMFGLTPLDRAWCRRRFAGLKYDGLFSPPGPKETLTYPSSMGGGNWGGAAYDPKTNLLVIKSENLATTMSIQFLETYKVLLLSPDQ